MGGKSIGVADAVLRRALRITRFSLGQKRTLFWARTTNDP